MRYSYLSEKYWLYYKHPVVILVHNNISEFLSKYKVSEGNSMTLAALALSALSTGDCKLTNNTMPILKNKKTKPSESQQHNKHYKSSSTIESSSQASSYKISTIKAAAAPGINNTLNNKGNPNVVPFDSATDPRSLKKYCWFISIYIFLT